MGHLGQQLSNEQWTEFRHCVKKAGIITDPWWEAVKYEGPPKILNLGLFSKRGLFSKNQIAAGNDYENLQTMADYIMNHPEYNNSKLLISTSQSYLQQDHFAIVQKNAWRDGNKQIVVDLLRDFGIDQELIDHTLGEKTEELLGYVLTSSFEEAHEFAKVVEIGATSPYYEGTLKLIQFIEERARSLARK